ncbi:TonB-dependent receptor [Sphingobium indicum]|uniref:TonB-dependent receptor n=2 Tax=Sphingobium indicum TaxID=332055 RepID=A0A1L5BP59_SPHIB|nr:TonB-dependent receptor [Sphingobium indicum]APL94643.1 TonB-dependent receptor [Sphingobium indicum B90A]KEY99013.1 TonB-dependent receptor [Sphingomonas sp. BHC-A]NYI23218.1 catecholate siderophore receptor [Sphingobium indicum]RYM04389.1 TonB-dependent receptor [Sphingobium indicum]
MSKALSRPSFLALGCVGAIAFATSAQAQDAAQGAKLGGMTVTDTAIDESPIKVEKAESPKYTRPLLDTPQTITVIGKETIRQQNLLTLREVLSTVPGITFGAGEGGFGYGDRIILRGQDAKNDVTVDGVRSGAFLNRNEVYNIEQVEVTNGANSVMNGGGSVAGTINLVTKRPLADDNTILNAGIGTDNYYRATIDANKRVNDLIAVRLNAVYHRNDVPGRDVEDYERWGVAPAITIGIDSPTSLTLQGEYLDDKAMPQYGIRYFPALGGIVDQFDRSGYYGFANLDRQDSKTKSLQAIFSHAFSDTVKVRNLTRYEHIRQDTVTSQPNGVFCLDNGTAGGFNPDTGGACTQRIGTTAAGETLTIPVGYYLPIGGRGNQRFITNETAYNQIDLSADFDTGGIGHTLVVGGSALWERYDQLQGSLGRTANGFDPYAAPFTTPTTGASAANPAYNAAASLGFYLPLVNIADPSAGIVGPAATTGLPRVYGSNNYVGPVNFILGTHNVGEQTSYAAYLFDTMKFTDWFEINGGIRYEKVKGFNRTFTYNTTGGSAQLGQISTVGNRLEVDDNLFSFRVGAVVKPTPDTSLYVAFGNSKLPSKSSVDGSCTADNAAGGSGTCNVRPETTKNYEIGAKADLFDKQLLLTLALFRNDRNQIKVVSGDPLLPDQATDGHQRVEGVSFGASGNITSNWTISANYMYLKSKIKQGVSDYCLAHPGATDPAAGTCANSTTFLDPTAGYSLTNTPKHSGSLFTTYRFGFGLELGYGLTYQGSFLLNQPSLAQLVANSYVGYRVPSYTIHRFMASYPITENLTAQVNVQNFTNEKYVTTVRNNTNNSWAQPAPTRSAVFSLNYMF